MQKLVSHLQVAFRSGPMTSQELEQFLERRGLRWVDSTDIFLACREHGLAELGDDDRWIPRGWEAADAPATAASSGVPQADGASDERGDRADEALSSQLTGQQRVELQQLRAAVVPTAPVPSRRVTPSTPSREWLQFVDEAVRGLDDELAEVGRRRTLTDVPLRGGVVRERGRNRQVVRYEAESEPTAKDGMSATLVLETGSYDVEVISTYGVMVTLAVPLEAQVDGHAKLRCDLSYLLGYQARRLRELKEPDPDFDMEAALELTRPDASEVERAEPYWTGELNEQQSLAVGQALSEGTTWIWGPPGTGKTTTLAALLSELYAAGRRVWLTAPTNMAVDIALHAALEVIESYELGSIARVGQPALGELRDRETPVLVSELVDLRSAPLEEPQARTSEGLKGLRDRLDTLSRADGDGPEMRSLELRIAEHLAYLKELEHIRADARQAVVNSARLVAATAQQALLAAMRGQRFDVVVIDEASMLPASLAAIAAGAGRGHTIVAGDFRQLPPVVVSDQPMPRRWLGRSAFEAAGIDRKVLRGEAPDNLVSLRTQHRMAPALSDAITAGFYRENPLETAPSVLQRTVSSRSAKLGPIVCVDTSALHTRIVRRGGVQSRYNLMHALLIADLLDVEELVGPAPALISPFAPQARLLEALVGETGRSGEGSTVHRFQGGERDVVVFDTAEAAGGGLKLHPWFAEGDDGTSGARLVNVAASRARERLVLVADFGRVHRGRHRDDALSRFFTAAQADADFVAPGDVLPTDSLMRQPDLKVLGSDVEAANERVEVWSKSIDFDAVASLIDPLLAAVERGVEVSLWFEPDGRSDLPRALEPLRNSGVLLRPCSPVRESSAVIDDVVWAAAGPLLSGVGGDAFRRKHKPLADTVVRMTRRRELGGSASSGESAGRCGSCGGFLVRLEGFQTRATCLRCESSGSARAGRRRRQG